MPANLENSAVATGLEKVSFPTMWISLYVYVLALEDAKQCSNYLLFSASKYSTGRRVITIINNDKTTWSHSWFNSAIWQSGMVLLDIWKFQGFIHRHNRKKNKEKTAPQLCTNAQTLPFRT